MGSTIYGCEGGLYLFRSEPLPLAGGLETQFWNVNKYVGDDAP